MYQKMTTNTFIDGEIVVEFYKPRKAFSIAISRSPKNHLLIVSRKMIRRPLSIVRPQNELQTIFDDACVMTNHAFLNEAGKRLTKHILFSW